MGTDAVQGGDVERGAPVRSDITIVEPLEMDMGTIVEVCCRQLRNVLRDACGLGKMCKSFLAINAVV